MKVSWPTIHASWQHPIGESNFSIDASCSYDSYGLLYWALYDTVYQDGCNEAMGTACPEYLKDDALVIQIRSGDIFKPNPHPFYKQPPVAFYEKIFQSRPWKSMIFVTENNSNEMTNPVWHYYYDNIKNRQKNMLFQRSVSFHEDLHLMLCSRYFVTARSSLSDFVIQIAPNLKEFYTFSDCDHMYTSNRGTICSSYELEHYVTGSKGN